MRRGIITGFGRSLKFTDLGCEDCADITIIPQARSRYTVTVAVHKSVKDTD